MGPLSLLGRLLVPLHCAGCGRADYRLCPACLRDLSGPPRQVDTLLLTRADGVVGPRGGLPTSGDGVLVPVFSLAPYVGRARAAMLAWKSGMRRDLTSLMGQVGFCAGRALAPTLRSQCVQGIAAPALLVVPAPSGMQRRLRGALVVHVFARAVAHGVAAGWGFSPSNQRDAVRRVLVVDLLALRGASQAGRGKRARGKRSVQARTELPAGWPVLLVDDVLTTGATLGACARAVTRAGGRVVGALTALDAGRGHVITGSGQPN